MSRVIKNCCRNSNNSGLTRKLATESDSVTIGPADGEILVSLHPEKHASTWAYVRTGDAAPSIAVNRQTGTLYLVWQDARFSGMLRDGIAFSKSTNGGLSWTAPVQINKAPKVQAFTASVRIS